MVRAFVFGKFHPFHKGHEAMMRFALEHCDALSVLVCCSDGETIAGEVRAGWIREALADAPQVEVVVYSYSERELPNTSESSAAVSEVWSAVFKGLFPDHGLLVTSEPYGELVAEMMGIRHLAFDVMRHRVSVSATAIRRQLVPNWNYLPDAVKPYYAIKVAILGTESTGKTVLTEALARHYGCGYVLEAARDLIADSNVFDLELLGEVAAAHAAAIDRACRGGHPLVILDTELNTTRSYAEFALGQSLVVTAEVEASNRADLYLYLCNDVPFVQDGTRLDAVTRDRLDLAHRRFLAGQGIAFTEISGVWADRAAQAIEAIDSLLKQIATSGKPS